MKKIFLLIALIITSTVSSFAQKVNLSGQITSVEEGGINFAAVVIYPSPDSLTPVAQAICDIEGNYVIKGINVGDYILEVSCLGYETFNSSIKITTPSVGDAVIKNIVLNPETQRIDDVVVTAQTKQQGLDKTSYIITKADLDVSTHSIDLLSKIPKLSYDPVNQTLGSQGGNVKILINGANASEQDLLALNANVVKSIEAYDFPPARYAGYASVVNVITKELEQGFSGNISLQHAFTTTFGNDNLYLKYNWGKNQLSLSAATYIRGYSDVECEEMYQFNLNGDEYSRTETSTAPFGYDDNYITLQYTRNVAGKYLFQAKVSPNFQNYYTDADGIIEQYVNGVMQQRVNSESSNSHQFTPTVDLYSNIYLSQKEMLMINLTGTIFDANSYSYTQEVDAQSGEVELFDELWQQNNKKSLIADAEYSIELPFGAELAIGNKYSYSHLNTTTTNTLATGDYTTTQTTNNAYAELSGAIGSLMYRVSLGGDYYASHNDDTDYNRWTITPFAMIGYKINANNMVRGAFERSITNPTLTELSPNSLLVSDGVTKEGNPMLENSVSNMVAVMYSAAYKWIEFDISGGYRYDVGSINSFFVESDDYISLRYENAEYLKSLGLNGSISIIPFKDRLLTLKAYGGVENQTVKSEYIGEYTHLAYTAAYEATLKYKNFSLMYQGNIPMWSLNGPYMKLGESRSNLIASYQLNNFTFSANCYWFLTEAVYQTESIATSLVEYNFSKHINDNNSMVVLGISWRFNKGSQYNEGSRYRNNSDRDSGLFK